MDKTSFQFDQVIRNFRKSVNFSKNRKCCYNCKPYKKELLKKKKKSKPLIQKLYEVCEEVFADSKPGFVPPPADIKRLRLILDSMKPSDVGLSPRMFEEVEDQEDHPVIYIHIYACAKFSIGIFCLPACGMIPLHNHPGMTVLSKLLFGSMHVKSYDWVDGTSGAGNGVRLAKVENNVDITAPCESSVLYPEAGGNIHSFKAITPCAFLDVQGPPYSDDEGRHCTYYRHYPFTRFSDGEEIRVEEYAWLQERQNIEEEFIVTGGSYQGPNIC
jgi:cysteamine dioxygenase